MDHGIFQVKQFILKGKIEIREINNNNKKKDKINWNE